MSMSFETIAAGLLAEPDIARSRMFGSTALAYAGKVFAMEVKGDLVVKLDAAEAAKLVADGAARVFDPGHGRPMKQWIAVGPEREGIWNELAAAALAWAKAHRR